MCIRNKDTYQCFIIQIDKGRQRLVQNALIDILPFMADDDQVSIMNENQVILAPTSVRNTDKILAAFDAELKGNLGSDDYEPVKQLIYCHRQENKAFRYRFIDLQYAWYDEECHIEKEGNWGDVYWKRVRHYRDRDAYTFAKEQMLSCLGGKYIDIDDYDLSIQFDESQVKSYQLLGYQEGEEQESVETERLDGYTYIFYELDLKSDTAANFIETHFRIKTDNDISQPQVNMQIIEDLNADQKWALTMLSWGILIGDDSPIKKKLKPEWIYDLGRSSLEDYETY